MGVNGVIAGINRDEWGLSYIGYWVGVVGIS